MLGKLLKYEFKSTSRIMWILYGAVIVIALLLGIVVRVGDFMGITQYSGSSVYIPEEAMSTVYKTIIIFLSVAYVLVIQAALIITTIMIILRFYRNILGDEGYLMHTLPVSTTSLIVSKLIMACGWILMAVLSAAISVLVFGIASGFLGYIIRETEIMEFLRGMFENVSVGTVVLMIVSAIVSGISSILLFYFSMAIGNLANRNKFVFSVVAYIGIQVVLSIVFSILAVAAGRFFYTVEVYDANQVFNTTLWTMLISNLIYAVISFVGTDWILKNKLNLA